MDIRINLLPWREAEREYQKKLFLVYTIASVISALLIVGIGHFYGSHLQDNQRKVNQYIQQEINILNVKLAKIGKLKSEKAALLSRIETIHHLEAQRPLTVQLLEQLVRLIPKGVHVQKIQRQGNQLTIEGQAESNSRISQFMRNIETSTIMREARLHVINTSNKNPLSKHAFKLKVEQKPLTKKEAEEL